MCVRVSGGGFNKFASQSKQRTFELHLLSLRMTILTTCSLSNLNSKLTILSFSRCEKIMKHKTIYKIRIMLHRGIAQIAMDKNSQIAIAKSDSWTRETMPK